MKQSCARVTSTDPYRQPPLVDRLGCDIADTKIDDLKAVLVGIKTPIALAEDL